MANFKYKGHEIYFETKGSGEPLLIIHGNTTSSIFLKREIEFYSNIFKVISVDLIGHGKSKKIKHFPINFWHVNACVLKALCSHLKIKNVNILGISGGAIIALDFAINYPEITNKIIADSFIGESLTFLEAIEIKNDRTAYKNNDGKLFWSKMHGQDWETVIDADTEMLINFSKLHKYFFKDKLETIKCPVLILGSLKDNLISNFKEKMKSIKEKNSNFQIFLFESGYHPSILSCRENFRQKVIKFLN